jgi:signal transduction histidine kinase/CheY-like chemotaxis protein
MLKIAKGGGKLLPVPRLRLRSESFTGQDDLARLIAASPEEFFSEIDETLFLIGANIGPQAETPAPQGTRADLIALDLNGRAVAVVVEANGKPSCFVRALLCSQWLAGWGPRDFLGKLSEEAAGRLREFLLVDGEQLNRDQRLILVAASHDEEILWAAHNLRKQCGVDITLLRATLAADSRGGERYLSFLREFPAAGNQWGTLLPQPETGAVLQFDPELARPAALEPVAPEPVAAKLSPPPDLAGKQEALRTFASGFADYLSHALAAVAGSAELALREAPRDSGTRQRFEEICRVADRVGKLTDQLRVYSGRGSREIEKIEFSKLIEHVAESAQGLLLPNVELRTDLDADLPAIEGDASQIARVVTNLLDNAVEALPQEGGVISVGAGRMTADRDYLAGCIAGQDVAEGDYLFLDVADSGYGMDEDLKARILDPFFTTKASGRGLGLAAVAGIVRNHQGALRLETKPAAGSTFRILFPLIETGTPRPAQQTDRHSLGNGRTALVVDDQESARTLVRLGLEAEGFRVLTVADGWETLDVFARAAEQIDVVVLDWMLPNMDAEEVFRAIRRIRGDTRIVLSGRFPQQEASRRFAGKRLTAYLRKPFEAENLIACLRQLLEKQPTPSGAKAN